MAFEWWSIAPPVLAILLAIFTRRIVPSLLLAVFAGALIWKWGQPVEAVTAFAEDLLWSNLAEADHLRVFVFTLLMGAMIGLIHASGGMQDLVNRIAPVARGRRGGQLITWLLGLVIFIDDYANSLLLGTTMRPLCDRLRISRAKLAYLVDSTAAPVSGLAIVSTWVAGEIGYIQDGFAQLDAAGLGSVDGFAVFVETIPYRFYVLYALAFVPLVALMNRDFGPMWRAEQETLLASERAGQSDTMDSHEHRPAGHWIDAVVPVLLTVFVTVGLLYTTGSAKAAAIDAAGVRRWMHVIGGGSSYLALVYGSLSGVLSAWLLIVVRRRLTTDQVRAALDAGARQVLPALVILWLAWSLSDLTDKERLGTGEFLGSLLTDAFDPRWMPTVVFVLASLVAFCTGTSWGTMGVLMPLVVPVTYRMISVGDEVVAADAPLMLAAIGSVLAGAIFGDHCSPISDTTVLSSQASGCHHLQHVWTQMPYALTVAAVSIVFGTIPAGFGWPPSVAILLGLATLVATLLCFGRRNVDQANLT